MTGALILIAALFLSPVAPVGECSDLSPAAVSALEIFGSTGEPEPEEPTQVAHWFCEAQLEVCLMAVEMNCSTDPYESACLYQGYNECCDTYIECCNR